MAELVETDADRLMKLVENKKVVSAKEAAKMLGMSESKVREWAEFLEKNNLINLKLNFFKLDLMSKKEK